MDRRNKNRDGVDMTATEMYVDDLGSYKPPDDVKNEWYLVAQNDVVDQFADYCLCELRADPGAFRKPGGSCRVSHDDVTRLLREQWDDIFDNLRIADMGDDEWPEEPGGDSPGQQPDPGGETP